MASPSVEPAWAMPSAINMHGVISIGGADRRKYVLRAPLSSDISFQAPQEPADRPDPACRRSCKSGRSPPRPAVGPASSGKRPPEIPQWEITGTDQPTRSRDFIICAPGCALATRMMLSAPAFFKRSSCATMSTSAGSNFSVPTIAIAVLSLAAATRPFSFDWPHGLLSSIRPAFFEPNFWFANLSSFTSTRASTAETRKA